MRTKSAKKSLILGALTVFTALAFMASPLFAYAQSNGPDFQITSSKDISAIAGESFTYFVVTENNTEFQLASQLPAGLSFTNNQISGVPQEAGEFAIDFTATDSSGSTLQTVNLTVIGGNSASQTTNTDTSQGSSQQSSQQNTGQTEGGEQVAQAQGSVGLNEIPDTGLSADQALTVGFYALALMLLAYAGVRRFAPALATNTPEGNSQSSEISAANSLSVGSTDNQSVEQSTRHIGDGIV